MISPLQKLRLETNSFIIITEATGKCKSFFIFSLFFPKTRGRRASSADLRRQPAAEKAEQAARNGFSEHLGRCENIGAHLRAVALRDAFVERVLAHVPTAQVTGHPTRRLPGTASFTFAGTSGEAVLLELERRGLVTSSGSACGIAPDIAQSAVRFTFGHALTADLSPIADAVAAAVSAVRSGT